MTDRERMDWLDADPTRLEDVRGRINNEGGSARGAVDWFVAQAATKTCVTCVAKHGVAPHIPCSTHKQCIADCGCGFWHRAGATFAETECGGDAVWGGAVGWGITKQERLVNCPDCLGKPQTPSRVAAVVGLHGHRSVDRVEDALSLISEALSRGATTIVVHVATRSPREGDQENRSYEDWVFGPWSPRDLAVAGLRISTWAMDCFPKDGE